MRSLSEVAKELKIKPSSLNYRMGKIDNFRQKYCVRKKSGRLYMDDYGFRLLNHPKSNSTSKNFHTRRGTGKRQLTSSRKSELINQLLDLNHRQGAEIKALKVHRSNNLLPSNKKLIAQNKRYKQRLSHITLKDWLRSKFHK